jgi:hypothetical protein
MKCTIGILNLATTSQTKHDLYGDTTLHMLINAWMCSHTCDGLDFGFFVLLLDVDWWELCFWHHAGLVQKQQTLVYVDVIVIMWWGGWGPQLSK